MTDLQNQILKDMQAKARKSISADVAGVKVKATYVQGYSTKINEDGLKKALGATRWVKVTKMVVDKKKLEEAMSSGLVDPMVVGQHVQQTPNQPYLRVTESLQEDA